MSTNTERGAALVKRLEMASGNLWRAGHQAESLAVGDDIGFVVALLDVAEAAQEWGRFACYKIPEKVALTNREWAEAECGECPSCRLNAAIDELLPQKLEEQYPEGGDG
jgi:hypothetical protein